MNSGLEDIFKNYNSSIKRDAEILNKENYNGKRTIRNIILLSRN
jgi:hypothetical protein